MQQRPPDPPCPVGASPSCSLKRWCLDGRCPVWPCLDNCAKTTAGTRSLSQHKCPTCLKQLRMTPVLQAGPAALLQVLQTEWLRSHQIARRQQERCQGTMEIQGPRIVLTKHSSASAAHPSPLTHSFWCKLGTKPIEQRCVHSSTAESIRQVRVGS